MVIFPYFSPDPEHKKRPPFDCFHDHDLKNSITDFFQKVKAQHFAQNALYRQKIVVNLYLYGHFDDILEPEPGGQKMGQPITDYAAFLPAQDRQYRNWKL